VISRLVVLRELPLVLQDKEIRYEPEDWEWQRRYAIKPPTEWTDWINPSIVQPAWVLSIEGDWVGCTARRTEVDYIHLLELPFELDERMSGSPILDETGAAIEVLWVPPSEYQDKWIDRHPVATCWLPKWLWSYPSS
jgi:hypothetical protein